MIVPGCTSIPFRMASAIIYPRICGSAPGTIGITRAMKALTEHYGNDHDNGNHRRPQINKMFDMLLSLLVNVLIIALCWNIHALHVTIFQF